MQDFMINTVVFARSRSAVQYKYLVEWRTPGQNLQASRALTSVWRRCEQNYSIRGHREVMSLLWLTYKLRFVRCLQCHCATRVAFVSFLRHVKPFILCVKKLRSFHIGAASMAEPSSVLLLRRHSTIRLPGRRLLIKCASVLHVATKTTVSPCRTMKAFIY